MLLERYKPKTLKDVIGNATQIMEIKSWLKSWGGGALIVYGPPGCGKSLCVELVAAEGGYELVESHAVDARGYKDLKESILKSAAQQSLFYKRKIILIDELEVIDSVKGIMEIIQESNYPVILVASDPYEQKLSKLRKSCKLVKFDKIRTDSIASLLRTICTKESFRCEDAVINQLSKMCNGDVRSAVIDLECASVNNVTAMHRDKEENVFETLKILFKTIDLRNSRYAIDSSEKSPEELFLWLEENIPNEYERVEEIALAYDWLSKADIVTARITKRQSWALQKYYNNFLCSVSFAKSQGYKKFTSYMSPRIRFGTELGISEKLAKKLHISKKEALQYLKLISIIKNKKHLSRELDIPEEELEALQ